MYVKCPVWEDELLIPFKALVNAFTSKSIGIRGCRNASAHFLPSPQFSGGRSPTPRPLVPGTTLLAAARGDVPALCAAHPLLRRNAVTLIPQLLVSLSSLKAWALSIFQWNNSIEAHLLWKKLCRGIKNPILTLSVKLLQTWFDVSGSRNWGIIIWQHFWGYRFPRNSSISATWCVTYSPHIILQFPDQTVTFSNILSALLSKMSKLKAKTLK